MSTSTSAAPSRAHGPSHWGQLNHVLGEWWQNLRLRSELESLDTPCCAISACRAVKSDSTYQSTSARIDEPGLPIWRCSACAACRVALRCSDDRRRRKLDSAPAITRQSTRAVRRATGRSLFLYSREKSFAHSLKLKTSAGRSPVAASELYEWLFLIVVAAPSRRVMAAK